MFEFLMFSFDILLRNSLDDEALYCVLVKTSKGIHDVRLDDQKVLRAPGSKTKYLERF